MKLVTVHNQLMEDRYAPPSYNRKTAGTVVLEQPDPEAILQVLQKQFKDLTIETVSLKIGGAFLFYKDQLNRKLGRKIAMERMKDVTFTIEIHNYQNMNDSLWVVLRGVDDTLHAAYNVTCKIYRDDRKLRVMGVTTREWKG